MAEALNTQKGQIEIFREDFAGCWRAMPDKAFFLTLLAVWLALFQFLGNSTFGYVDTASLFGWLLNAYNAPGSDDGHGNLVPLVVLVLFWWKRQELLALPKHVWCPALFGLAAALLLHLAGYIVQQPRLSTLAFFLGLYFLMGLAWGPGWLQASFFPFVLLVFCIPAGSLAESITFPMRRLSTYISAGIGQWILGIDVIRDGTRLFDARGTFQYDVAPACSGIRSLITLLALNTIYGFVSFRRAWKRVFIIALALPLALAGNVVRIVGVIVVSEAFGQATGTRFHDGAGFVTFALAIVCIFLLGGWLKEEQRMGSGLSSTNKI